MEIGEKVRDDCLSRLGRVRGILTIEASPIYQAVT
jgi:hypothetical protein